MEDKQLKFVRLPQATQQSKWLALFYEGEGGNAPRNCQSRNSVATLCKCEEIYCVLILHA